MIGENFENYLSQMAKNSFKLSTMVGENFYNFSSPGKSEILFIFIFTAFLSPT